MHAPAVDHPADRVNHGDFGPVGRVAEVFAACGAAVAEQQCEFELEEVEALSSESEAEDVEECYEEGEEG